MLVPNNASLVLQPGPPITPSSRSTHLLAKLPDELPSLANGIGGRQELDGQDGGADSCRYLGRGDRYGGPHRSLSYFCGMMSSRAGLSNEVRRKVTWIQRDHFAGITVTSSSTEKQKQFEKEVSKEKSIH